jgi:hypothetical protein
MYTDCFGASKTVLGLRVGLLGALIVLAAAVVAAVVAVVAAAGVGDGGPIVR